VFGWIFHFVVVFAAVSFGVDYFAGSTRRKNVRWKGKIKLM